MRGAFDGLDGTVYDYFHGYDDLMKKRVVFVGDAKKRIQEDYLRILRYFRFYGRIAENPNCHDIDTLQAIKENGAGLANISGERVWMELSLILSGNFWGELMELIIKNDLGPHIGIPKDCDVEGFIDFHNNTKNMVLRPITRLTPLFKTEEEFWQLHERLKLSGFERDLALFIIKNRNETITLRWCKYNTIMLQQKVKLGNVQDWILELLKYKREMVLLLEYSKWEVPKFPVNGGKLKEFGVPMDRTTAIVITKLKEYWIEHDCEIDAKQILEQVPAVLEEIKASLPPKSPKPQKKKTNL